MKGLSSIVSEALQRDMMEFGEFSISKLKSKHILMCCDYNSESVFGLQFDTPEQFEEEYGDVELGKKLMSLKYGQTYTHKDTGIIYTKISE